MTLLHRAMTNTRTAATVVRKRQHFFAFYCIRMRRTLLYLRGATAASLSIRIGRSAIES
jgi:hypothetical protein